jgi:transposase InsO family protein
MCVFYRRFIQNFSQIARPLHELTKESVKFVWGEAQKKAFEELKHRLTTAPVLAYPNFHKPFTIYTDASREGLGAILSQLDDKNQEHPVAYISRALLPSETRYPVTELEGLALHWAVKQFRPYIYGRKFTVVTDHLPLIYIFKNKTHDGRFARWIASLGGMHFEVRYRPGKRHANVDALSRASVSNAAFAAIEREVSELDLNVWTEHAKLTDFALQQRNDSTLQARIDFLETGALPHDEHLAKQFLLEKPRYLLKDGLLVHLMRWSKNAEPVFQTVVPHQLKGEILQQCHSDAFAAHFGIGKTFDKIAQRYYWDGYFQDVERYVNQCSWCARYKQPARKHIAPLQPLPVTAGPWERVGVDLMGPLPPTKQGNTYIVVFTDYFTRWVEAVPLPNKASKTVATAFVQEILCRYGSCNELLSDRGTEFLSNMMQEVCKICDIKKKNTTAYHPMCNGLTERFNKVLGTMLGIYIQQFGKEWDAALPFLLFAYRSSIQSSLKFSPHKILFGREPRIPGELSVQPAEHKRAKDYSEEVAAGLQAMKSITRKNLLEAQERQKRHYDKDKHNYDFPINTLVWLQTVPKGLGAKLQPKWDGPYIVLAKPSVVDSVIRRWANPAAERKLVHNNRLKPCHAPWQLPPVDDDEEEDDISPTAQPATANAEPTNRAQQRPVEQQQPADAMEPAYPAESDQSEFVTPPTSPPKAATTPMAVAPRTSVTKVALRRNSSMSRQVPQSVNAPRPQAATTAPVPSVPAQDTQPPPSTIVAPPAPPIRPLTSRPPPTTTSAPTGNSQPAPARTRGNGLRANPAPTKRYQPEPWTKTKKT